MDETRRLRLAGPALDVGPGLDQVPMILFELRLATPLAGGANDESVSLIETLDERLQSIALHLAVDLARNGAAPGARQCD